MSSAMLLMKKSVQVQNRGGVFVNHERNEVEPRASGANYLQRREARQKRMRPNLCINTSSSPHISCCSVANLLQVTFVSRGEPLSVSVLLFLLMWLSFHCTTTRLQWTIGFFMFLLFCHTKDSYVHCSQWGWMNRPVSHEPPTGC